MNPAHINCPPGCQIANAEKERRVADLARSLYYVNDDPLVRLDSLYRRDTGGWFRPRRFLGYRCHLRVLASHGGEIYFTAEGNGPTPLDAVKDALLQPVPFWMACP